MKSPDSLWSELPLVTGIAALVSYAGIFNDVIGVEEVASRLGVAGQDEFYTALNQLHRQGKLILKDGFAGLPNLEDRAALKISKIAATKELIDSGRAALDKLAKNPLIKFVGISGSLAADNPTRDRNNRVDIDVFLITRNQCMWLFNILRGLRSLFPMGNGDPELCANYIMDESDLLVTNRNFYTATEIRNLIPVSGHAAYRKFLRVNHWVNYYYPGVSGVSSPPVTAAPSGNLVNKFFYGLYATLRKIKWLGADPLKKIASHRGIKFSVMSPHCGGYHAMVQEKFTRLARTWFPDLLNAALIEKLFPDELSAEIRRGDLDVPEIIKHVGLGYDYGKYG